MSKRLQVLLSESEWQELQRLSKAEGTTIAEWVRRALRSARRAESHGDVRRKLEVVRAAARNEYPTADIGQMLAEIERGYGGE